MQEYLYNLATDKYRGIVAAFLKSILFALSIIYGLIIRLLASISNMFCQSTGCKVISIGNITLGGTGKTVAVEYVARFLKAKGKRPAILSRGYKRKVTSHKSQVTSEEMGDEPFMLKGKLKDIPVIVDSDRLRASKKAVSECNCDTVILDDGFQQWRIKKDLDIVLIDATNPFGNRHMIPRGILREPLSALKRAGAFIITKVNLNADVTAIEHVLRNYNTKAIIAQSVHQPVSLGVLGEPVLVMDTEILRGKSVVLFSGIGDPRSFEALIESCGAKVALSLKFPDHHDYSKKDAEDIIDASRNNNVDTVITTEKDVARFTGCQAEIFSLEKSLRFLYLRIELKITNNEQGLHARLLELYNL